MNRQKPPSGVADAATLAMAHLVSSNPVHQNPDGKWYFWDEVWVEEYGPFESKAEADKACAEYARSL